MGGSASKDQTAQTKDSKRVRKEQLKLEKQQRKARKKEVEVERGKLSESMRHKNTAADVDVDPASVPQSSTKHEWRKSRILTAEEMEAHVQSEVAEFESLAIAEAAVIAAQAEQARKAEEQRAQEEAEQSRLAALAEAKRLAELEEARRQAEAERQHQEALEEAARREHERQEKEQLLEQQRKEEKEAAALLEHELRLTLEANRKAAEEEEARRQRELHEHHEQQRLAALAEDHRRQHQEQQRLQHERHQQEQEQLRLNALNEQQERARRESMDQQQRHHALEQQRLLEAKHAEEQTRTQEAQATPAPPPHTPSTQADNDGDDDGGSEGNGFKDARQRFVNAKHKTQSTSALVMQPAQPHIAKIARSNSTAETISQPAGNDDLEELDARALAAAEWVNKEIRKLITEITARGVVRGSHSEISFGQLFYETDNIFEALAGTLKTAKKYGVVDYEGDLLFQGSNDTTMITLLKDSHEGIEMKRRRKSAPFTGKQPATTGFGGASLQNSQSKCAVCAKTVYAMEFLGVSGKALHKACFKCETCRTTLKLTDYCIQEDKFYCTPHYTAMFYQNQSY